MEMTSRHDMILDLGSEQVAQTFAALGAPVRLDILRALVRAGPEGQPVGRLKDHLDLPASTLSHHLKAMIAAGVISQRREGRVLRCFASYDMISGLAGFLLRECCVDAATAIVEEVETA